MAAQERSFHVAKGEQDEVKKQFTVNWEDESSPHPDPLTLQDIDCYMHTWSTLFHSPLMYGYENPPFRLKNCLHKLHHLTVR